jgi:hypothetical protein
VFLTDTSEGFEAFEARTLREPGTGLYIVDGDTPVLTREALRQFYEQHVRNGALAINRVGGVDDRWSDTQKLNLTYCVSTSFGGNYNRTVQAMADAAAAWEQSATVNFIHVSSQDSNCTASNPNVVFDVNPVFGAGYLARAFFPSFPRSVRNVLIDSAAFSDPSYSLVGILKHELGHALGFRHEHTRPEAATCFEDNNWRGVTSYDSGSVMHYPFCNGTDPNDLNLTQQDRCGATAVYGGPHACTGLTDWGYPEGRAWVDFNGDGLTDYCRVGGNSNGVDSRLQCTLSTGTGFGASIFSGVLDWGYPEGRVWTDFNGDGRADYCRVVGVSPDLRLSCTVSTGTGFGATYTSPSAVDLGYATGRAWVDFNGDGRRDYCRVGGNSNGVDSRLQCTLSTGTGFGASIFSGVLDWGYADGREWTDFNGDGRADYCRVVGVSPNLELSCTVSTGTGFGATYISPPGIDLGYPTGRAWVDFNGDGRRDYCRVVGFSNAVDSRVLCTLSTGTGFGTNVLSYVIDWGYAEGREWADFNGDGRADYCRRVGADNNVASSMSCTVSAGTSFGATSTVGVLDWGELSVAQWVRFNGDTRADYCRLVAGGRNLATYLACTNAP